MEQHELRALSLRLELDTGCDSIPTIERVYDRTLRGAYECPHPGCRLARMQAAEMWRHVHFGPHGLSFGVRTPEEIEEEAL